MNAILELDGLCKTYKGGFTALHGFGCPRRAAAHWAAGMGQLLQQFKVNFALFKIYAGDFNFYFIAQAEGLPMALANQALAWLIKGKEVIA